MRFPEWSKGRPKLKRWLKKFSVKHPELAEMLPK
jgi:glutathione S-transferase